MDRFIFFLIVIVPLLVVLRFVVRTLRHDRIPEADVQPPDDTFETHSDSDNK